MPEPVSPVSTNDSSNRRRKKTRTLPKPPEWPLPKVMKTLKEGRSVLLVFDTTTKRRKYEQRIIQEAVKDVGEPRSTVTSGPMQQSNVIAWPNKAELGFTRRNPDEDYPARRDADVVRLKIPENWQSKK